MAPKSTVHIFFRLDMKNPFNEKELQTSGGGRARPLNSKPPHHNSVFYREKRRYLRVRGTALCDMASHKTIAQIFQFDEMMSYRTTGRCTVSDRSVHRTALIYDKSGRRCNHRCHECFSLLQPTTPAISAATSMTLQWHSQCAPYFLQRTKLRLLSSCAEHFQTVLCLHVLLHVRGLSATRCLLGLTSWKSRMYARILMLCSVLPKPISSARMPTEQLGREVNRTSSISRRAAGYVQIRYTHTHTRVPGEPQTVR